MKKGRSIRQLAAAMICMILVHMTLPAFGSCMAALSAHAAERDKGASVATPTGTCTDWEEDGEETLILDYVLATGSQASPSNELKRINMVIPPDLAALDAGEADEDTWQDVLPGQVPGDTDDGEVMCDLLWSVPYVDWDKPGIYPARVKVVPPAGYTLGKREGTYDAAISIHPPGTSQVLEVFTFQMRRKSRTWTVAMKQGQDMTPLKELLENTTFYKSIIDTSTAEVTFTAEWDFSAVDPDKPGIYPIYRHLTLNEDQLPEGLRPEDIYLPEYWRDLPVLFSVEEPGGPQLYGVLEGHHNFFGSYAKLSEAELAALEVWYSIDGGEWTRQTDEGLMETWPSVFYIEKRVMDTGKNYSFRLKLGEHVSRELTVQKTEPSLIWYTCVRMGGERDGTIEVEFPAISQPPITDPGGEGTDQPITGPDDGKTDPPITDPDDGEKDPPSTDPGGGEENPPSTDPGGGEEDPPSVDPGEGGNDPPATDPSGGASDKDPAGSDSDSSSGDGGGGSGGSRPGPSGGTQSPVISGPGVDGQPPSEQSGPGVNGQAPSGDLGPGVDGQSPSGRPGAGKDGMTGRQSPEDAKAQQAGASPYGSGYLTADGRDGRSVSGSAPGQNQGRADAADGALGDASGEQSVSSGSHPVPEEIVTRWTTQISGTRVRKLIELYPEWIRFQKEEVSVLLSSQWLSDQQMRDNDVLTVSVSPEDHTVTILINQKEPLTAPVFQITVDEKANEPLAGAAAAVLLALAAAGAAVALFLRRWRS